MTSKQIDRYRVIELLGQGGMGKVYRAYDPHLDREVVLKFIHLFDSDDDEWRQRFQREVRAAGSLSHPHIITVYDVVLESELPYVVMELLTGGTLKKRLKEKPLPWREAFVLLRPLVEALAYAHRTGIIHRDIKPENVMFAGDANNTLKLVDFGLARWQEGEQLTRAGTIIGTPAYMSPEQVRGQAVDGRTDIFAFGIILFEAIVGRNPLYKNTALSTIAEVTSKVQIDLSPLVEVAPPNVINLIKRATLKKCDRRYPNCEALLADLNLCLEDQPEMPTLLSTTSTSVSHFLSGADVDTSGSTTAEIEPPFGTMHPNSRLYIERTVDGHCRGRLSMSSAVTLFIQAPRQMGKSSLMRRVLEQTKQTQQKIFAFIDFQKFPEHYFDEEENFLVEFCMMMSEALGLPEEIEQYWRGRRTNIMKCSRYVSEYIIPQLGQSLILAMDEVERLLSSSFRSNFFGMLRTWHNDRVYNENLANLTLFLSSSTEPYLFIDNPNQSPFNVAEVFTLQDFTRSEVEELNRRHRSLFNQNQIEELMDLVGGHPFLTRLALYLVSIGKTDPETLFAQATEDTGPFGDHLRHYLLRVLQKSELKEALIHICREHDYKEDQIFYRLKGAGLVKRVDQQVVMCNRLYTRYFEEHLNV